MSTFVQLARDGKVKHPTQKGFKPSEWGKAFCRSADNTSEGLNLFEAGKWIFERLESVRSHLSAVDLCYFDKDKALQLLVADLNITVKAISEIKIKPSFGGDTVYAPQFVQHKLKNEIGANMDPDSVLGISTDGARFPIAHISNNGGKTPHVIFTNDGEIISRIKAETLLGQYYDFMEGLWIKVLWHGWKITEESEHYIIQPAKDHWAVNRAISDYRHHLLLIEALGHTVEIWRSELPREVKEHLSQRPVVTIEGSGKEIYI